MRISHSWLKEYVDISPYSIEQVANAFTHLGFEVEEIIEIGSELTGPIVIGKVLEIETLTEYKKPIRFCRVQVGPKDGEVNEIICGATNFKVGDHVIVALPGAVLPGGFQISARSTYDRISNGMICSLKELGIGDEHAGILVVENRYLVGSNAVSELQLVDTVFDLSILPDRGYAMSVRGLARELAGFFEANYRDPALVKPEFERLDKKIIPGKILAQDACSVLYLSTIENFRVEEQTPWEMKRKLILSGMRSISLAVDITNFIMLELGQPLHAFDATKVDSEILVRFANTNESVTTLDGVERNLTDQDLVIADKSKALSIAGIMGGAESEISNSTQTIVLEAANFQAAAVSASSRRFSLASEAGRRFERGVDPALPELATIKALNMFHRYGKATIQGTSITGDLPSPRQIYFDNKKFETISGLRIDPTEIKAVLERIGCQVSSGEKVSVNIPSWRPDLHDTNDLAEEILRLVGYDQIPMFLPVPKAGLGLSPEQRRIALIRSYLASNSLMEVLNYPFISHSQAQQFILISDTELVRVANPLSEESPYLRPSLLPGLLLAMQRNLGRGSSDLAIFEMGSIFRNNKSAKPAKIAFPLGKTQLGTIDSMLPMQEVLLAGIFSGAIDPQNPVSSEVKWDWARVVRLLTKLFDQFQIDFVLNQTQLQGLHPGRSAEVLSGGVVVGRIGEVSPRVQRSIGAVDRILVFELDMSVFTKDAQDSISAKPISTFPVAKEDLSVLVGLKVSGLELVNVVKECGLPELEAAELFDLYQGPPVPADQKSFTLALRFRALDRTLSSEEIARFKGMILQLLSDRFGATLRS
ncbi:MAG: phenylalanine--tRNA ligase subunit beta [Candidatus Nanopelagicales bacterium]